MKGNGLNSVQLNGDREGSLHQESNENRHTNLSRKEKKEILVSSLAFLLTTVNICRYLHMWLF